MTDPPEIPEETTLARWHERYEALRDLLECYSGLPATDTPAEPSAALTGYLEVVTLDAPGLPALAAAQARLLLESERLAAVLGDNPVPESAGLPWPAVADRPAWLAAVAGHLEDAALDASARADAPTTPWGWRRCFPMLHQLFGGYFGQDHDDLHGELSAEDPGAAALAEWAADVPAAVRARTLGELHELSALAPDRAILEPALSCLALDVRPVPDPHIWLTRLAGAIRTI